MLNTAKEAPAYAVDTLSDDILCGTGDSYDARCGFAPPGTNAGTKARIRYLFSSDYRNGSVSQECSHAVRGSRVYD
ncbi:hypothetical protein F070042J6_37910 [Bacteroides sp. f07]